MFSSLKVPCGSKIILRLDGRGFYKLSKQIGLKKPYDNIFLDSMVNTAIEIFREFSPAFIYTFSDEFNILMADMPFSGRIEKLDSVFASFTANSFYSNLIKNKLSQKISKKTLDNDEKSEVWELEMEEILKSLKTISFDCRVIPVSSEMVPEYFKGRQDEAWRNCLNGYVYWTLRDEMSKEEAMQILNGLKSKKIHDILFENGINIAEVPSWQRRGVGIYKVDKMVNGYNPLSKESTKSSRRVIDSDFDLPRFDNQFFNNFMD